MSEFLKKWYPAFESGNFSLFFVVQGLSFLGTVLQSVVQGWLVYSLTNSVFSVALNAFLGVAPTVLLAPIGGAVADRYKTKNILRWTTWLGLSQAMILWLLFTSGHLGIYAINSLAILLGVINGFDSPLRYASIAKMVRGELVASANGANGMLINFGFIAGPSIGGFLIAELGVGPTFFLNAVSFVPLIWALPYLMFANQSPRMKDVPFRPFKATVEGIRYAASHTLIGLLLVILTLTMTLGAFYRSIMPAIAREMFGAGPIGFGWLSAAPGVGALIGATLISRASKNLSVARIIFYCMSALGFSLIAFSRIHTLWLGMLTLTMTGFGLESIVIIVQTATANLTVRDMIGRVMGCGASIFFGGIAIGGLFAGWTASHLGLPAAIGLNGAILIVIAMILFSKKEKYLAALAENQM